MKFWEFLKGHPGELLELILLAGNTVTDLRTRRISPGLSGICALCGMCFVLTCSRSAPSMLLALLPGLLMTAAGIFGKGQVGTGDGIVILISGLFLTLEEVLTVCAAASLLALIPAGILFLKGRRKARIPFVPFLLAGYILTGLVV